MIGRARTNRVVGTLCSVRAGSIWDGTGFRCFVIIRVTSDQELYPIDFIEMA